MQYLFLFFVTLFSLVQLKANTEKNQEHLVPDTLVSIDTVCRLEIKNCEKLGRLPHQETLRLIQKHKNFILTLGYTYGVQPNLIAGIFLAEQSLLFNLYDVIEDKLAVYIKINFSIGPLQITPAAAEEAEKLLSQIDKRPTLPNSALQKKLLNLKDALYYATGYLLYIQNAYKKNNLDISNSFGLVGTLYTLGSPHKRARRTVKLNKPMQMSYYGYFIEKNKNLINQILYPKTTIADFAQPHELQYQKLHR